MDASTVAEIGYQALMKGKAVVIPGLKNKILAQSIRFSPRRLTPRLVKHLQKSK
jgi:hypothetical protein